MSLAEIPQNNIRRNGQTTPLRDASQRSKLQAVGSRNGDENASVLPKPAAIQSMLRNTTETGDVGQFAMKPPRVTTSSPQASPATSKKPRVTSSRRRHPGSHSNGHRGYNEYLVATSPGHASIASNSYGYRAPITRQIRRMPSLEDYRSYSMTQSSYESHSLIDRHPHVDGHLYGRRDFRNSRPYSPFAYPTRLKRPGYRVPSPGQSELNMSSASGHSREPSTRTASPSSAYNANRTPSPFRYIINRSDPTLKHYPPYLASESVPNRTPPMSIFRPTTPNPPPTIQGFSNGHLSRTATNGSWIYSQTPPASPIFYDYTEDFEEYHGSSNVPLSLGVKPHYQMSRHGSAGYPELANSLDSREIPELPSDNDAGRSAMQNSVWPTSENKIEINEAGENMTHGAIQDLSDVPELPETDVTTLNANAQAHIQDVIVDRNIPARKPFTHDDAPVSEDVSESSPLDGRETPRAIDLPTNGSVPSATTKTSIAESSSVDSSMLSPRSLTLSEARRSIEGPALYPTESISPKFAMGSSQQAVTSGDWPIKTGTSFTSDSLRGPSFEGRSMGSMEIVSPTPERSITSPRARDRFSKILSIDEGPDDKDARKIEDSIVQASSIDKETTHKGVHSSRSKLLRHLQIDPSKQNRLFRVTMNGSDSEEEPGLTPGLRRTFCKKREYSPPEQASSPCSLSSMSVSEDHFESVKVKGPPAESDPVNDQSSAQAADTFKDAQSSDKSASHEDNSMLIRDPYELYKDILKVPPKKPSYLLISPPHESESSRLPFNFTPLIQTGGEKGFPAPEISPPLQVEHGTLVREEAKACLSDQQQAETIVGDVSAASPPGSIASRPGSRPWNNDSSYPWNDQAPRLEVTMPRPRADISISPEKTPCFKLKIHRASSSTGGTSRLRKELCSYDLTAPSHAYKQDASRRSISHSKPAPNLSIHPGQLNSSHDVTRSNRQQTRFVETFETQSPTTSFIPLSPNEVRSFFSDDSSQMRPKGSFRKRFSDLKARAVAVRAASMDDSRGHDRGLLTSALGKSRASGRSSRQSQNTTGATSRISQVRPVPSKMINKLRLWVHRGGDKVREWGWHMRYNNGRTRSAGTALYAGV